jgi:hypothetical protein
MKGRMNTFKSARVFSLMAAILAAGCGEKAPGKGGMGGDMGDQTGGTADMVSTSSSGFSIAVANADTPYAIEGITAPSGRFFVFVRVTISNTSATPPVLSSAPLFSVKTKAAIVVPPAGLGFNDQCGELSVATGGQLGCSLLFELPVGETAAELDYADGLGRTASAPIPLLPAISCDTVQGWKSTASAACMSCIQTANKSCIDLSSCSQTEQSCITSTLQSAHALACRDVVNTCSLATTCLWRMHRDCLAVACNDACK